MEAARSEFLAAGYRSATVDQIAKKAGVAKRSIYLWHRDKASLFEACIVEGMTGIELPQLDPAVDLSTSLTTYGAVLLPALSTEYSLNMSRLLFREAPEFDAVRKALTAGRRLIVAPVYHVLVGRGLAAHDASKLAEAFVATVVSGIQAAIVEGVAAPENSESMRHLEFAIRLFIGGLSSWQS
jgi:AcrR family transcriptional regulator